MFDNEDTILVKFFILISLILFLTNDSNSNHIIVNDIQSNVDRTDSLIENEKLNHEVYVKIFKKDTLVRIFDFDKWPENIVTTYNIYYNNDDEVLLFIESPYSESGDWSVNNRHYFNGAGNTILFRHYSGYFNSLCSEVLREYKTYYFDVDFKLLKENYELLDTDYNPIDSTNCVFNYKFDFKTYKNYQDILEDLNLLPR